MSTRLPGPPDSLVDQNAVVRWMREMQRTIEAALGRIDTTKQTRGEVAFLRSFTVATLPSAAPAGKWIYVTDETGGAVPAFSDGTDWRRCTDRAVVS